MALPATLRENSTWTPKSHVPSNRKIFQERMNLIKKWYSAWDDDQRWTLLEYLLRQQNDSQLLLIHSLLHPTMPPPDHDFTRVLPRYLTLKIFSLLDPQSLCRAAQVCWFWKFLAESNGIWQKKCLRLGWFLPTPPLSYDYTVWKRHYIACVCQLHWHPPQAPEQEEDIGVFDVGTQPEETKKRKKKRWVPHKHTLSTEERKPWKDPDRIPHDIEYQYSMLYTSVIELQRQQQPSQLQPHTHPFHSPALEATQEASKNELPPPDSLIHPVLLEKMRLGSPSVSHTHLSTLNFDQSQQGIHEAFYDLHKTNPFPRLPPYYVHKSEELNRTKSEVASRGGAYSANRPSPSRRPDIRRPSSGKGILNTDNGAPLEYNRGPQKELQKQLGGLRTRPWSIPTESDDDT